VPQLVDIDVDFVSLVDRAAVRDPQRKSEPRRFLLMKREGANTPEHQEEDVSASLIDRPKPRAATKSDPISEALAILRPSSESDDDIASIVVALESLAPEGDDEASEQALEKAMHGMRTTRTALQKSTTGDPGMLSRIDQVSKDLQRRYLSKKDTAFARPEVAQHLP
jgi:hypothetical protein